MITHPLKWVTRFLVSLHWQYYSVRLVNRALHFSKNTKRGLPWWHATSPLGLLWCKTKVKPFFLMSNTVTEYVLLLWSNPLKRCNCAWKPHTLGILACFPMLVMNKKKSCWYSSTKIAGVLSQGSAIQNEILVDSEWSTALGGTDVWVWPWLEIGSCEWVQSVTSCWGWAALVTPTWGQCHQQAVSGSRVAVTLMPWCWPPDLCTHQLWFSIH